MMVIGIIKPADEPKWISLTALEDKKIDEIKIYVNLRKLNDASLCDPFLTPFDDEVLDFNGFI